MEVILLFDYLYVLNPDSKIVTPIIHTVMISICAVYRTGRRFLHVHVGSSTSRYKYFVSEGWDYRCAIFWRKAPQGPLRQKIFICRHCFDCHRIIH